MRNSSSQKCHANMCIPIAFLCIPIEFPRVLGSIHEPDACAENRCTMMHPWQLSMDWTLQRRCSATTHRYIGSMSLASATGLDGYQLVEACSIQRCAYLILHIYRSIDLSILPSIHLCVCIHACRCYSNLGPRVYESALATIYNYAI